MLGVDPDVHCYVYLGMPSVEQAPVRIVQSLVGLLPLSLPG